MLLYVSDELESCVLDVGLRLVLQSRRPARLDEVRGRSGGGIKVGCGDAWGSDVKMAP